MNSEMVTTEQAVQRLADHGKISEKRIANIETKITTMVQEAQELNRNSSELMAANMTTMQDNLTQRMDRSDERGDVITEVLRDLKNELRSLSAAFRQQDRNELHTDYDPIMSNVHRNTSTPRAQSNAFESQHQTGTINESNIPAVVPSVPNQQASQPSTTRFVTAPSSTVPIFHGKSSEHPKQFLIRIKEYAKAVTHWDDDELLSGISQFFLDTALDWYCQLRENNGRPDTWAEFEIVFLRQFNSPMHQNQRIQEWRECVQGDRENISDFAVRLRNIWSQVKPKQTEEKFLYHLARKIRSELVETITLSRATTTDGIIADVQKMEQVFSDRNLQQDIIEAIEPVEVRSAKPRPMYHAIPSSSRTSNNRQTNNYRNNQNKSRHTNYTPNSWKNTNTSQPSDRIYCFGCGETGHLKPYCPYQHDSQQYHQQGSNYPKNTSGARVGRDNDAPM